MPPSTTRQLACLALLVSASMPLVAQTHGHTAPAPADAAAAAQLTTAEVRRIDAANHRITLRHAEIKHLDMPAMTMVFKVREGVALEGLKDGDQIRFRAEQEGSNLVVTEIVR
jgi:Cu(I)/Ag(I) efflux system protein CusF